MKPCIELNSVTYFHSDSIGFKSDRNRILNNVSLNIYKEEILCIVGESGSGKTTLAKIISGLLKTSTGTIKYSKGLASSKKAIQILFQNSDELLNPYRKVADVLNDVKANGKLLEKILSDLNISDSLLENSCGSISGGERQRIALARVMLTQPQVLILDEPFSAQDIDSKENFKSLLTYLRKNLKITLIVVTHDVSFIENFADRIVVLFGGKIMEILHAKNFFNFPKHPYSKFLLSSTLYKFPIGFISSQLEDKKSSCPYYSRCNKRDEKCIDGIMVHNEENSYVFCNNPYIEISTEDK